jgi:superfamily I DNA/RNA helicase
VVNGRAGYGDHATVMCLAIAGIGKKTLEVFKDWCYQNRFSPAKGLSKAKRFPVTGLSTARQQLLNDYSNHIEMLKTGMTAMTVAEKVGFLVKQSKLSSVFETDPKPKDALETLVNWAKQFGHKTEDFILSLALHTDTDAWAERIEKVSLMTMHAAKGLEFPVVFISGCEQGYIPFQPPSGELLERDIQEERRLFYVAITRAMARLYFTYAKKRRIYGQRESRSLSPFVANIETRLKLDESPRLKKKKEKIDQKQLSLF